MSQALTDAIIAKLQSLITKIPTSASAKGQATPDIWLGFSGGMDSALLAYALSLFIRQAPEWRSQVHLVHVHHGLNKQADKWAEHCLATAREYQLDASVVHVEVKAGARVSVEAEARSQRYQALASLMQVGDILLTAHHQDDQLETVLLALKRGLGPKGIAAMGEVQSFAENCWQLRPMLGVGRGQIEHSVQQLSLDYVEDDSNADTRYDRNFLRHDIIPNLISRWPAFAETASRSAVLCAEQQSLLEEVGREKLQALLSSCPFSQQQTLNLDALATFSAPWQRQLVRQFIMLQHVAPPSQIQLQQLLHQLLEASSDAEVSLTFGDTQYRRANGMLYLVSSIHTPASSVRLDATQSSALKVGSFSLAACAPWHQLQPTLSLQGARIAMSALDGTLEIVYGLKGSTRCHPHWRQQGRELKKVWQEAKVPTWLRPQIPGLVVNGRLIAIANLFVERDVLAADGEQGLLFALQ